MSWKEKAIVLYNEQLSCKKISEILGVGRWRVHTYLFGLGLTRKVGKASKKYNIDETFFEKINSSEKAYILGLIYADGNVTVGKKSVIRISLQEEDSELLHKINVVLGHTKPLEHSRRVKNETVYFTATLQITRHKMAEDLQRFGCVSPKTKRISLPNFLEPSLVPHFIRGYFDGDGSLYFTAGQYRWSIRFSGNQHFIMSLHEYLDRVLNIDGYIYEHKPTCYSITFWRADDILRLLGFIYSGATLYMSRKYNTYLEAINYYKTNKNRKRYTQLLEELDVSF